MIFKEIVFHKGFPFFYGGDYNPEEWDEKTLRDIEFFYKAGFDILTINVFNWAMLQPEEEIHNFSDLNEAAKRDRKFSLTGIFRYTPN